MICYGVATLMCAAPLSWPDLAEGVQGMLHLCMPLPCGACLSADRPQNWPAAPDCLLDPRV